jgi:hypothetical protein
MSALGLALGWHGFFPVVGSDEAQLPQTGAIRALRLLQDSGRAAAGAPFGTPQVLMPNIGVYWGIRDARGRGVPTLDRPVSLWRARAGTASGIYQLTDPSDPAQAELLRLFAVKAAMVSPGAAPPPASRLVYNGADADVYELVGALPRAFVACQWSAAISSEQALAQLHAASAAQLRRRPVVEGVLPAGGSSQAARAGGDARSCAASAARITRDDPAHVEISVRSPARARLVLLDNYYPGWKASVDGQQAAINATNLAFRSIEIPPGTHTVRFDYQPGSLRWGLGISGLCWITIFVLAFSAWRTRAAAEV